MRVRTANRTSPLKSRSIIEQRKVAHHPQVNSNQPNHNQIMKTRFFTLALLFSLFGLFTACAPDANETDDPGELEYETEQALSNLGAEIREESNEMEVEFREARTNLDRRMEEMERDMENASAEARAEMEEEYNELKAYGDDLDARMDRVGNNMEAGWKDFKGDVNEGWKNFSRESREVLRDIERATDPEGNLQ